MQLTPDRTATRRVHPGLLGVLLLVAVVTLSGSVVGVVAVDPGVDATATPTANFETDQSTQRFVQGGVNAANLTTVQVSHAGGDAVDASQVAITVNGYSSAYDIHPTPENELHLSVPVPTHSVDESGSVLNDCSTGDCPLASGDSHRVATYGFSRSHWRNNSKIQYWSSKQFGHWKYRGFVPFSIPGRGPPGTATPAHKLVRGDLLEVRWRGASGNASQTLQWTVVE